MSPGSFWWGINAIPQEKHLGTRIGRELGGGGHGRSSPAGGKYGESVGETANKHSIRNRDSCLQSILEMFRAPPFPTGSINPSQSWDTLLCAPSDTSSTQHSIALPTMHPKVLYKRRDGSIPFCQQGNKDKRNPHCCAGEAEPSH